MSNSLWPHQLHHARLFCPSLSPGVCSDSCPLSQWCYLTVIGRKSTLTPYWKLFLWLPFIIIIVLSGLPGDPVPLLDCKLKCLCSAHGEIVPAHLWIEETNTPLPKAGHSLGDVLKDWRPFEFTSPLHLPLYSAFWLQFLIASFSLIYITTWHPDPNKMAILRC